MKHLNQYILEYLLSKAKRKLVSPIDEIKSYIGNDNMIKYKKTISIIEKWYDDCQNFKFICELIVKALNKGFILASHTTSGSMCYLDENGVEKEIDDDTKFVILMPFGPDGFCVEILNSKKLVDDMITVQVEDICYLRGKWQSFSNLIEDYSIGDGDFEEIFNSQDISEADEKTIDKIYEILK